MTAVPVRYFIQTFRQHARKRGDGTVEVLTKVFIDVPRSELTWHANCEVIAAEFSTDAETVEKACRRLLVPSEDEDGE